MCLIKNYVGLNLLVFYHQSYYPIKLNGKYGYILTIPQVKWPDGRNDCKSANFGWLVYTAKAKKGWVLLKYNNIYDWKIYSCLEIF